MKNYLRCSWVIFLMVAFTEMHAQVNPGYIWGVNSTMTLKTNGITTSAETPLGIHFGGYLDIPVSRRFTFMPSLLFSAKGTNYTVDSLDYSLSPAYIEVPVIIMYTLGKDVVKVSLFTGPYFACVMGGYKLEASGELKNISIGSGEDNDLKPFDIGLNFGAGVSIKGILISAQYGIGLLNVSPVASVDSEMKNKVIGISISSLFRSK
jgi:hypothetical protein